MSAGDAIATPLPSPGAPRRPVASNCLANVSRPLLRLRGPEDAYLLLATGAWLAHSALQKMAIQAMQQQAGMVQRLQHNQILFDGFVGTAMGVALPDAVLMGDGVASDIEALEEGLLTMALLHLARANAPLLASDAQAVAILGDLARKRHRVAMLAYGKRQLHGRDGLTTNCEAAVQHLVELAMEAASDDEVQTNDRAQHPFLWELFEDSQTAVSEHSRADNIAMYERLQDTGDLEAAEVLGETYFHGDPAAGVEQDHVRAREMFELAAK